MTDAPRHTARQIADDVAAGMDPDVECVAAQYCAAYEARIAELEAEQGRLRQIILDDGMELARVKAESLRVVEDGTGYWWMTPTGPGIRVTRWATGGYAIETPYEYHNPTKCKRVRLERWETEE